MKLIIKKLLKGSTKKENVFFYPCNRVADYNQLYEILFNFLSQRNKQQRLFIFLDEISFVKEWQRSLKDLADSGLLKKVTLLVTGSNALDLKFSSERLPGRRGHLDQKDFLFLPLRFANFLKLVKKTGKKSTDIFQDYLLCGGFPEVINQYYDKKHIPNYLYDIYLTWIEGDLHKVGKSEEIFYNLSQRLFQQISSTTSWYSLAKHTGLGSHSTAEDYIDILQKIFVLLKLNYYNLNQQRGDLKKNKKIYFLDPFIHHAIRAKTDNFTDQYFFYSKKILENANYQAKLIENIVAAHLASKFGPQATIYYGHYNNKEIDFVVKKRNKATCFEVKYRNTIKINDFSFWNKKQNLTIITKNQQLKIKHLELVPIVKFLRELG